MKHAIAIFMMLFMKTLLADGSEPELRVQHRRPSAAALINDGRILCVANRRSGTLSLVDTERRHVSERQIGQQLSDVVVVPGSDQMLVTDFAGSMVVVVNHSEDGLNILDRVEVAAWPESVVVNQSGDLACVASLWSRRVNILKRREPAQGVTGRFAMQHQIDLPFAPKASVFVGADHVVVADCFGGRLAVIDCEAGVICAEHELPVHNIRDIAPGSDGRLYLTCQRLNSKAHADYEDIHWGILLENEILAIHAESLINPRDESELHSERISLGGPGEGAGDPGSIVVTSNQFVLTLAGTDELAIVDRVGVRQSRIPVGRRPVSVIRDAAVNRAYVVNSLSDSVSLVDLINNRLVDTVSLGSSPSPGPVERGEVAFFSAKLSHENWMSCHSCHTDGHTNNGLADTLGDSAFGDAKRVPTLRGVWSTGPWAWNGSEHLLNGQIRKSLRLTMRTSQLTDEVLTDLTAYVTKLERPPAVAVARDEGPHPTVEYKGREVFESAGCSKCHNGFTSYTTDDTFDVGLSDAHGESRFNPPSLSGISQRDRFLHDGRARSIEDVLIRIEHPLQQSLPESDRKTLIEFLLAL